MSADDLHIGLAEDLAARSDDDLVALFVARPDLAAPPPQGSGVLGQRALSAASITLAGEDLDVAAVAVLEQLIALSTPDSGARTVIPVASTAVIKALGKRADRADVLERIDLLRRRALVWGGPKQLMIGAHTPSALPWKALQLTGPLAGRSPDDIHALLDGLDEGQSELLGTLSRGPALGRTRDAAADADPARPIPRLIALGLLARVDEQTVELPPMVGQLLRGEAPIRADDLRRPTPQASKSRFSPADVEAAAGGEAIELIRHTTTVLRILGTAPAALLRSGALGVRELRRIAKAADLDPQRVGLIVELLSHARLIDAGLPDPPPPGDTGDQYFAPTGAADAWLHQPPDRQWSVLAAAWLDIPRRPWQIGTPDRDGNALAALSADLFDAYAPAQRRTILETLALAGPAQAWEVAGLCEVLVWSYPRQMRRLTSRVVTETLREARDVGLVAHGCVTTVGRTALAGEPGDDTALVAAMHKALPEPVDHFLTQADLTLMVPGPLTPELAEQVELIADLESGGAASVYRITEASVRRALDTGRSSSELITMLTAHSRTPVPQSLTYLIEDVARRHGQLRVGVASSFVRCEDPATLAAVLRSDVAGRLALRALAPTVAVAHAEVREVIEALRGAGFAPAGEDSSGALVDLREIGSRVGTSRRPRQPSPRRSAPTEEQLLSVISRLRAGDRAGRASSSATGRPVRATDAGESATALIQLALRASRKLLIGYVDGHGSASKHVVSPLSLGAGQLLAEESGTDDSRQFWLHRMTSVELLDN
ncbi:helicase-associated domain-containing protein [Gordonia sp. (in: high G+C Gram-positive bacteria)]|jgi:hypothetical protein|uniref:helicase-associated domain-containing protein n=2 Tax=Gordonia sp. (in: high G+C Gram-positive bacteria) TaxID=84139 RepID=UPI001D43B9F3|nr:helicase-associated domain-containing protein [Gordonia sp. (in: high G+C Gram-positive bacteria)]MCB1294770.1 helicase-associated domain-containing protein [Gordonia sp. (in: high G+C Gram-positive bacteria)]HMS75399.1 helicase-associated domain-containing protein [Gordonia sp. (in: high G+C Gram-positive bacteria)]